MSRLGAKKNRERALSAAVPTNAPTYGRIAPKAEIKRFTPLNFSELSWSTVQSILQNAERGYPEYFIDLSRRALKSDDHYASVYETRIAPVAGAKRTVVPPTHTPEALRAHAELAAADCLALLDKLPNIERTFAQLLDAEFVGFAVQEIIWQPKGDMVWPVALEWLNQRRFRFADDFTLYLWDSGQATTRAKELGIEPHDDRGISGLPLTPRKYVVHIPQVFPDYPTCNGLFLPIVRAWWTKAWCMKFWLSGAEIAGSARMIGTVPQEADGVVVQEMYEQIAAIAGDSIGVIKEGSRIELLDPKAQGTGSVWETLIKRCDAAISKAILGSTLNVEVGDTGGSFALGESQGDITITPRLLRSAKLLANTIERDLFRPFLEFNRHRYGGNVIVPNLALALYEEQAEIDDVIVTAGAVTIDELRASRGLEPWGAARGGDRAIPAQTPAAPQYGFGEPEREGAPAAAPLRDTPWSRALRAAMIDGSTATGTSGR